MASATLDIPRLSSFADVAEDSVNELLSEPNVELLTAILSKISKRARDYEECQSSNLKLKVELENAVRAGDAKYRAVKSSLDKSSEETGQLRKQLQTSESSRQTLQLELESAKSNVSTSGSELDTLQIRISSLEASQRDTVALLEKKSSANDELTTELSTKHQKNVELRMEISNLEQKVNSANSSSSASKLQAQETQQEVEALKRHNEWLDQELKTKSSEHAKFRKEKNLRVAELQQENEDIASRLQGSERAELNLRSRLEEFSAKIEDYSSQIHNLKDENIRTVENSQAEIDTNVRLADLLKESLDTERRRHRDLVSQLEDIKQSAAEEIGRINAEVEREHQERETAERRMVELEVHVERLEADARLAVGPGAPLSTPKSRPNTGNNHTPRRESSSRALSPLDSGARGGINYTQLITDYHVAKNELDNERRRNEKLSTTIDEMIRDMEQRQPEIVEMQNDHKRIENDIVEMSNLLDTVGKERDQAKKDARRWERQVAGLTREGDVLRQQLRDLSSQVKILLMEINTRNAGFEPFTQEERTRLESLAMGDLDGELAQGLTDTDRFINQHLSTFRGIADLQEQNQKLLRVTRELGEKMEGEEARAAKAQAFQNQEELDGLRQRFERSKDEIKVLMTQSQSYIKERDMFRRMLSHRGTLPANADLASLFGESQNGSVPPATPTQNGVSLNAGQSPSSKDVVEFTKALRELQVQYDNYRQEAATHRAILREQSDALAKQNGELRVEASKRASEATLAVDRYDILNGNYTLLKGENEELKKRSQSISERLSKQEIRTQQVAEDLVEAKGLAESLRNETANLKAEKDFWKGVEKRLNDDNLTLRADRDRLNGLNVSLQSLLNDREHGDSETRRRLQGQLETTDNELRATQKKLAEEREENKRATLRREHDSQQTTTRTEGLMGSLGSVREELVAAKTSCEHLQARNDEITVELRNTQQRLELLQPNPSTHREDGSVTSTGAGTSNREQELSLEILDLKRDLELAQKELASNASLLEQYKAISQSSEEELQRFNETHDQYRKETDLAIADRISKIEEFEETVTNLRAEIASINGEVTALRSQNAEHVQQETVKQSQHESQVAQLNDTIERAQTEAQLYQEDLKKQAQIAQQAQQNYENELVKHAEAAQTVHRIRSEMNGVRLEAVGLKSSLEAAQTKLSQNEESWSEAKERYNSEISELNKRKADVSLQNKTLHDQLEKLHGQVADLRNSRLTEAADIATGGIRSSAVLGDQNEDGNLQELIKYLRQEKDIIETQFSRSSQESKRLRQQLEHTQAQLDDMRLKLLHEQRAKEDSERQALNHNKLMETIEELNLYRESNTTLRLEKNQIVTSLEEKNNAVADLQARVQTLQARVEELEGEKEALETSLRITKQAKERFEKRYLDVLNRSNAVDPAEFENAQQRITELENERTQLLVTRNSLQEEVNGFPGKIQEKLDQAKEQYSESRSKLIEQSKNKAREQSAKIREKDAALQAALQQKQDVDAQLVSIKAELESAVAAKNEALLTLSQRPPTSEDVQANTSDSGESGAQQAAVLSEVRGMREQLNEAKGKVTAESNKVSELQIKLDAAAAHRAGLEGDIANLQQSLNQASARITELEAQATNPRVQNSVQSPSWNANNGDFQEEGGELLRQELKRISEEADGLRGKLSAFEHADKVQEEGSISVAEQISGHVEEIRQELTARHESRVKQAEERYNARTQSMKEMLNKRLASTRAETQQKIDASVSQATEELKLKYNQEMNGLKQRHATEIAELRLHSASTARNYLQSASLVSSDSQTGPWDPTEAEIRDMLQSNQLARKLVMNSLGNRERKAREEERQKFQEQLGDMESTVAKAKKDAEVMVEKRFAVKFNLTENRMRSANAKIEHIQTAVKETPEKPVGEVWAIAKDAKPPAPAAKTTAAQGPVPSTSTTQSDVNGSQSSLPATEKVASSIPAPKNPFASVPTPNQVAAPGHRQPSPALGGSFGRPSIPTKEQSTISQAKDQANPQPSIETASLQQPSHAPQNSSLQIIDSSSGSNADQIAPTGGSASNRGQQSGLPIPRGGRGGAQARGTGQRGRGNSNIGRPGGRGSGLGRGSVQAVNATLAQNAQGVAQGQSSPRGNKSMNPNAQQFVPQKRSREESGQEASDNAGDEKRLKGGDTS